MYTSGRAPFWPAVTFLLYRLLSLCVAFLSLFYLVLLAVRRRAPALRRRRSFVDSSLLVFHLLFLVSAVIFLLRLYALGFGFLFLRRGACACK